MVCLELTVNNFYVIAKQYQLTAGIFPFFLCEYYSNP